MTICFIFKLVSVHYREHEDNVFALYPDSVSQIISLLGASQFSCLHRRELAA